MNVRIIGLGNVLMSDDGFGPYAARVLDAYYEFPDNVRIVDAGQPGIDLVPYLANADVVILIDTVRATGTPGDLHAYPLSEILDAEPHSPLCPHDPGITEALVSVSAAGGVLLLVFAIQILILAFKTSVGWGVGTLLLFVPVGLIYVAKNWAACKTPFLRWLISLVVMMIGFAVSFYGAFSGAMAGPAS